MEDQDDNLQSPGRPGDFGNPRPPHQPGLLAARLAVVKVVFVVFLLFWKPRYDSLTTAGRPRRPLPAGTVEDKESTLKDDDAWQSGRAGRPPRQGRHRRRLGRRRLAHAFMTVCAVSTLIVFLSVVVSQATMTWHPGGWPQI